jgi:hypothetical protein
MSREMPSFMLGLGQRQAPQPVSIIRAFGSFQPEFATGVRPENHLSQTNSTRCTSIFWVNVAKCRILSHRVGGEASEFAKFAVPATQEEAESLPVAFVRPPGKRAATRRFGCAAARREILGTQPCAPLFNLLSLHCHGAPRAADKSKPRAHHLTLPACKPALPITRSVTFVKRAPAVAAVVACLPSMNYLC